MLDIDGRPHVGVLGGLPRGASRAALESAAFVGATQNNADVLPRGILGDFLQRVEVIVLA